MPPKRVFAPPYSLPGNTKGKGKAPAIDPYQHNGDTSPNDLSRDQPALFVTPAPQATGSHLPHQRAPERKRPSEMMADMEEAQAAKRARTDASTLGQSVGPPRPTIENVEDEGDEQTDQSDRHGHQVVNRQPGRQAQLASDAVGMNTEAGPSRLMTDSPQGLRNVQSGQPGTQAAPSVGPSNTAIDLTATDDEDGDGNRVPAGHHRLTRTGITAPFSEFREAVRAQCHMKCEVAASTLSRRTDKEGKHIFHRCVGTAALLKSAKTLAIVRNLMANDVKDVLVDVNNTLLQRRDKYDKYFEREDDSVQKLDLKRILNRQDARIEKVEQARNWRKDLVNDLRGKPLAFLRRNI